MKPTIQFNKKSRRDFSDRDFCQGSALPQTDYCFQAASESSGGGCCFASPRQSFRAISQDYFENEAPRTFAGEAALFIVIVMTAALPILTGASALAHLVRSFGAL